MAEPRLTHILTAFEMEARAIAAWDVLDASHIRIHVVGLGAKRLPRIESGSRVVVAGLGGALDPALRVGDVVLDKPSIALSRNVSWHTGVIHTTDHAVTTPEEKATLFRQTGASAVDMELATIRSAVPPDVLLIGLRVISDPADMAIDPAVLGLVDDVGRPRPLRLVRSLATRPWLIRHLLQLRANANRALSVLGGAVLCVLNGFPYPHGAAYASPDQP
jgi:adenosylhomocysteine nucleosidase